MSKCTRSKRALDALNDISLSIASLRDLVEEGPGMDEKPKSDCLSIGPRERAARAAVEINHLKPFLISGIETKVAEVIMAELKIVEGIIQKEWGSSNSRQQRLVYERRKSLE